MTTGRVLLVGNFLSHARGHRHYCEDLAIKLEDAGFEVLRTSSNVGRLARLADMLRTLWSQRSSYDLVHCDVYSGAAFGWAEAVCTEARALRKPLVLTLHGGQLPDFARRWPRRVRRLLGMATRVTAPSEYLRDALASYRDDITVIPNGVALEKYTYAQRRVHRRRIVWLRALDHTYNPRMAVDVLALARRHGPTTLTMFGPDVGDGSRDGVESRARELGVSDAIRIAGPIANSEVPSVLADADVFLNTSNVDNTPVSLLEALATGTCVVTTAVGGIPYLVEHEREALLVPRGDASAAAEQIERVFSDEVLAGRLSSNGRALTEAFQWSRVIAQWSALFKAVGVHG